jgi:hypothetical protein
MTLAARSIPVKVDISERHMHHKARAGSGLAR